MFVGDVVDRGLQVTECLWLLYKLEAEAQRAGGRVHFIIGNHEQMYLTGHYKYVRQKYRHNANTLNLAYARWYSVDSMLGRWLRSKNVIGRVGDVLFVHGDISPDVAAYRLPLTSINQLARLSLDTLHQQQTNRAYGAVTSTTVSSTWYRGMVLEEMTTQQIETVARLYGVKQIVIGHTPVEEIRLLANRRVIAIELAHQQNSEEAL